MRTRDGGSTGTQEVGARAGAGVSSCAFCASCVLNLPRAACTSSYSPCGSASISFSPPVPRSDPARSPELSLVLRCVPGYPSRRLLEDLAFTQQLKQVGRTVLIRSPVETSGRRFLTRGPWRTFAFIVWLLFCYSLRIDTERYAERWRGPAGRPPGSPWGALRPGRGG